MQIWKSPLNFRNFASNQFERWLLVEALESLTKSSSFKNQFSGNKIKEGSSEKKMEGSLFGLVS